MLIKLCKTFHFATFRAITYIHTSNDHWCYLASVTDCHTKEIIGHHFQREFIHHTTFKSYTDAKLALFKYI